MTEFGGWSEQSWTWRALAGVVLSVVFLLGHPAAGLGKNKDDVDAPLVELPKTDLKSGRLTDRHDKSAEISGREHAFHAQIKFADDEGNAREWKTFRKGDYVQYHLKQGQIDFLILELPK